MSATITLHQTHHTLADFDSIFKYLRDSLEKSSKLNPDQLHLFPELFLTGYPLGDLCLWPDFIENYHRHLKELDLWAKKSLPQGFAALVGGLQYFGLDGGKKELRNLPTAIENVIYLVDQQGVQALYSKKLLPSYDIFDESKYFRAGEKIGLWKWQGLRIGLLICEDMWASSLHKVDPVEDLFQHCLEHHIALDWLINLSASPFHLGKNDKRIDRAQEIANHFDCSFAYCNRLGAEDEILFDGQSFICNSHQVLKKAQAFAPESLSFEFPLKKESPAKKASTQKTFNSQNTWESLFEPRLNQESGPCQLLPLTDNQCLELIQALSLGVRDYTFKTHHQKISLALSGGIDSGLVLTLLKLAFEKYPQVKIEAVYMPGPFSSELSYQLAYKLCQNLNISLYSFPIKFLHSTIKTQALDYLKTPVEGLSEENIQARLRGALIYLRSNQVGSLVINTSNRSEIAVGYSTQYGDSVGAISLIGDLYKSEVFELSNFINKHYGSLIPEEMITRAPSAELRPNQRDDERLPPYHRLDAILEGLLTLRLTQNDLILLGHNPEEVHLSYSLLMKSEYKRRQFCPIIKVRPKSFGFGHRVPITKHLF